MRSPPEILKSIFQEGMQMANETNLKETITKAKEEKKEKCMS